MKILNMLNFQLSYLLLIILNAFKTDYMIYNLAIECILLRPSPSIEYYPLTVMRHVKQAHVASDVSPSSTIPLYLAKLKQQPNRWALLSRRVEDNDATLWDPHPSQCYHCDTMGDKKGMEFRFSS